ncbi:MAG TPA: hypothetical protein VGQ69_02830 [Gemmatimonadales bacterium]|jgi:hypothetical protein|nr:hypothetical protein [Gemmatimonadales bacterium]
MRAVDPEGILAITFIFGGGGLFLLAISPVGRALADRIRHGPQSSSSGPDPEVLAELEQLRSDVTDLQERVDFAERLLAEKKNPRLPVGEEHS